MASPAWRVRDLDEATMRPARDEMRQWRERAPTLRRQLYVAMADPTVRANARALLVEKRPDVVPVFDRVTASVGISDGFPHK